MPFTPYDAAVDLIGRANELLTHAPDAPIEVQDDLRRMSIVMGVAALDTYMHRLVVQRANSHEKLPKGLASFPVSFGFALDQAEDSAKAARAEPRNTRPISKVKSALRERLLFESFQSFRAVSDALAMAGMAKSWSLIGPGMSPPQKTEQIRSRLDSIVRRRNQIAHEGDYVRLERPQGNRKHPIDQMTATADVDYLADLIDAIDAIT